MNPGIRPSPFCGISASCEQVPARAHGCAGTAPAGLWDTNQRSWLGRPFSPCRGLSFPPSKPLGVCTPGEAPASPSTDRRCVSRASSSPDVPHRPVCEVRLFLPVAWAPADHLIQRFYFSHCKDYECVVFVRVHTHMHVCVCTLGHHRRRVQCYTYLMKIITFPFVPCALKRGLITEPMVSSLACGHPSLRSPGSGHLLGSLHVDFLYFLDGNPPL